MQTSATNLFIVDDNKLMVTDLKYYLENKFGKGLNISTFYDGKTCLEKIDKNTQIVILDYHLDDLNGLEILKSIKSLNPKTEVIMLSGNESMALAIETFRMGAKDYVVKGNDAWSQLTSIIKLVITEPIRLIVKEFGVSKYVAIMLLTFITMGIVIFSVIHNMN
ncbi:MAG: response regulator [Bacteroidia bacterium]